MGQNFDRLQEFHVEILLDSLNLPELTEDFQLVCDLKLANIILGIQSCSSLYHFQVNFFYLYLNFGLNMTLKVHSFKKEEGPMD